MMELAIGFGMFGLCVLAFNWIMHKRVLRLETQATESSEKLKELHEKIEDIEGIWGDWGDDTAWKLKR